MSDEVRDASYNDPLLHSVFYQSWHEGLNYTQALEKAVVEFSKVRRAETQEMIDRMMNATEPVVIQIPKPK